VKERAHQEHVTRAVASIDVAEDSTARATPLQRHSPAQRSESGDAMLAMKPRESKGQGRGQPTRPVSRGRSKQPHAAFGKGDLDFVVPAFLVYDGAQHSRATENSDTDTATAPPVTGQRTAYASSTGAAALSSNPEPYRELVHSLILFADRTARQVASLLARRPFQTRFLVNQGPPAPAVRLLMRAVLLVLSALPDGGAIVPATAPVHTSHSGAMPLNPASLVSNSARPSKQVESISRDHVDWHSASRCLLDSTFARRFLRRAALMAASAAVLELNASDTRVATGREEANSDAWQVAPGAWRIDDKTLTVSGASVVLGM